MTVSSLGQPWISLVRFPITWIALNPLLSREQGNLNWDVSYDRTGLPCVTFENLPPPIVSTGPPPSPGWPVPELIPDSYRGVSTKETDIYVTPIVLFQVCFHFIVHPVLISDNFKSKIIHEIEQNAHTPKKQVLFLHDKPEIPAVIRKNKPLLRIVQKCLSPNPARRPTAAALCNSLLRLCKLSTIRSAVCDVGMSWVAS